MVPDAESPLHRTVSMTRLPPASSKGSGGLTIYYIYSCAPRYAQTFAKERCAGFTKCHKRMRQQALHSRLLNRFQPVTRFQLGLSVLHYWRIQPLALAVTLDIRL